MYKKLLLLGVCGSFTIVNSLLTAQSGTVEFRAGLRKGQVPEASTRTVLTPSLFSGCPNNRCNSLSDSAQALHEALKKAGYLQQGWHVINGKPYTTVAVITELEQIQSNGRPRTDGKRWDINYSSPQIDSLGDFVRTILKGAPAGRYRSFVFAFSPVKDYIANDLSWEQEQHKAQERLRKAVRQGNRVPVISGLGSVHNNQYACYVFVYEYSVSPANGSVTFVKNSSLTAEQHLQGSGIRQVLGLGR